MSFPFGFPGHNPATHTPDGTPIGAIYAAQVRQQPYFPPPPPMSAAEVALRDAVKREGAVCQLGEQPCGVAAVGRCYECSQTFCPSHRSFARPKFVAGISGAYFDWCHACQDRRIEQAKAKAAQEREAAELREQEAVRAHAAAVAAHEKASGWDPRRDAELDRLIASSNSSHRKPERMGLAVVLSLVAFAGLGFIAYAVMDAPHVDAGRPWRVDWVSGTDAGHAGLVDQPLRGPGRVAAPSGLDLRAGGSAEATRVRRRRLPTLPTLTPIARARR